MSHQARMDPATARWAWLAAGATALVGGTLLGANPGLLALLATAPAFVRAALVAGAVLAGGRLLVAALVRVDRARPREDREPSSSDVAGLVRGVRLVFLAVAAFAAAAGWLLGSPLPFVVALVIAGVDVLETSFLLVVMARRRDGSGP